jgi:O-antigen/teichoic acid export membrane protein
MLGNFASMATLRVGLAAMTFGLFWLLAHRLNTAQLGGFSLLMNAFFMVQTLPLLGMTMPLIRRVAAKPADTALECSNSFFFALPAALLIGAGLALTGRWYAEDGLIWPFVLLGLSMLPSAWTVVAECVLVGREKMNGIACVNLLEALGRLLGAWAAITLGTGLTGVFAVFLCLRIAAALGYVCNPHLHLPRLQLVEPAMLRMYRSHVPTYLAIAVVTALCTRIDIILVSKLLSLREVGIYAAAARLSDAALMVPTMAAVVIFPAQARMYETDKEGFVRVLERAVRWCLIAGFAVALVVAALASAIIHLIYAPALAPAAPILRILILGTALMVIDQLLSTTMMASHSQHADLRSMSVGLVTLVTLLFVGTHWDGLMGAAMAAPAALLVRVTYRLVWAQRLFHRPILAACAPVVLAAAAGVGGFYGAVPYGLTGALLVSLAAYLALLLMTRALRIADWRMLRGLIANRGLRA